MADLQTLCIDQDCMNNPICCNDGYFTGTSNTTINQGSVFDPRAGVNAYDENDNPIPFVAVPGSIDTSQAGTQYIAYIANGVDPVVREITIAASHRTVLYPDGTLIINEASTDQSANEALHGGTATNVYPAMDANNPYIFSAYEDRPWHNERNSVTAVEIGSAIAPTNCARWFGNMSNLVTADLTGMDTSNCTDMSRMFSSNSRMTTVNTEVLDTSACTTMEMMFYANSALTSLDLCTWDTSSVTHMGQMFRNSGNLATISTSSDFVVTQVTLSNNMFAGCTALTGGSGTTYDSNTVDKTYARCDCTCQEGYFTCSSADCADICPPAPRTVRTVKYNANSQYGGSLLIINESPSDQIANEQLYGTPQAVYNAFDPNNEPYIFSDTNLPPWNADTSIRRVEVGSAISPTSNAFWFNTLSNLQTYDLTLLDTSDVTDMQYMFYNTAITSMDLSSHDTSKVENMSYMFRLCGSLTSVNIDTPSVTNMASMFADSGLINPDLSCLDTSNVEDMASMFSRCESLTELDLCNFDTSSLLYAEYMFYNSDSLTTISVSQSFVTAQIVSSSRMFTGCFSLVGGDGTTYDSAKTDKTYAKIDGGSSDKGYFTDCSGGA